MWAWLVISARGYTDTPKRRVHEEYFVLVTQQQKPHVALNEPYTAGAFQALQPKRATKQDNLGALPCRHPATSDSRFWPEDGTQGLQEGYIAVPTTHHEE